MGRPRKSRIGEKPHHLRAVSEISIDGKWYVDCICDCGEEHQVKVEDFRYTKSCGCARKEFASRLNKKHGMSNSKEYNAWDSMKDRCLKEHHPAYKYYGGRGISISPEWMQFEKFYADMGEAPDGSTLDRIDVDEGYCKENCRWVDYKTQNNNKTNNIRIEIEGENRTLSEWCEKFNISIQCVSYRVSTLGLDYEEALTLPKMRSRK